MSEVVSEAVGASGRSDRRLRVGLVLAALSLIWGTQHLVIRETQHDVAPALAVALRFLIVGLVAELACRWGGHRVRSTHLRTRALFGVMHAVSMVLLYAANHEIPTALVGLLVATTPIFVTLLAPTMLPDEPLGLRQLAAAALGIAGIATLSLSELGPSGPSGLSGSSGSSLGILLGLGAAVTSASSRVASKRLVLLFPVVVLLRDLGVVAGVTALALWLAEGRPGAAPDGLAWAGIAYLALIGSALASGVYFRILRRVPVSQLSYQMLVTALIATLAGTLVRGEPFGPEAALGAVLVLVGLGLAVRR